MNAIRNIRLIIEYDGTEYCGFQDQGRADRPTIQSTLEQAISKVTGESVKLTGAGRTDAGVHAMGQVANFTTNSRIPVERIPLAVNTHLPWDIAVRRADRVPDDFHARFCARRKIYRYTWLTRSTPSPFWHRYALFVPRTLRVDAMAEAAACLVGEHDFTAFRSSGSAVRNTVREMYRAEVWEDGQVVHFEIEGSGFLYNMVRIIAGTLLEIGLGRRDITSVPQALKSGTRESLGATAPPHGLTLVKVGYDEPLDIGQRNPRVV